MLLDKNQQAFFELLRAGLWEKDARLLQYKDIDYSTIMRLAEEQSVVGLVAAGIEHVTDVKVPQVWALQFAGQAIQLEQRNKAMNTFVAKHIELLRKEDVYAILVKGQGIAQCYERPLWRASGDVDLLLSDSNYEKAKKVLMPLATSVEPEYKSLKHIGMMLEDGFEVELHGMVHSRLSGRVDKVIDEVQNDIFYHRNVRSWVNNGTQVFLPSPDNHAVLLFTHILKHFYIEGIGLRQICDWCRLIYRYSGDLDLCVLESRIRRMGLMTEWKAFGAFSVEYLGMDANIVPLLHANTDIKANKKKAIKILEFIMETGNFGHNRELRKSSKYLIGKVQAFGYKFRDFIRHARIFPLDSMMFLPHFMINGLIELKGRKEWE